MNSFPPKASKSQQAAEVEPASAIDSPKRRRFGLMAGEIEIPDDFNEMGAAEIEEIFYGNHNTK